MPRIPTHARKEAVRALQRLGFVKDRQDGSHLMMRHPLSGARVTIPMHHDELGHAYLVRVLNRASISIADYIAALRGKD